MTPIDARGLACPAPVIKAKNAIKALPPTGGLVRILVDNSLAAENLERMSAAAGYSCMIEEDHGTHTVTIAVGENTDPTVLDTVSLPTEDGGTVYLIGKTSMGDGERELGEILLKSFLYTLANQAAPPKTLLFFNSGVHLTKADANTIPDLQTLQTRGTRILVCGTCLDYYDLRPAVGEVCTMLHIAEEMEAAHKVITL